MCSEAGPSRRIAAARALVAHDRTEGGLAGMYRKPHIPLRQSLPKAGERHVIFAAFGEDLKSAATISGRVPARIVRESSSHVNIFGCTRIIASAQ
jgi:hypothetical protein